MGGRGIFSSGVSKPVVVMRASLRHACAVVQLPRVSCLGPMRACLVTFILLSSRISGARVCTPRWQVSQLRALTEQLEATKADLESTERSRGQLQAINHQMSKKIDDLEQELKKTISPAQMESIIHRVKSPLVRGLKKNQGSGAMCKSRLRACLHVDAIVVVSCLCLQRYLCFFGTSPVCVQCLLSWKLNSRFVVIRSRQMTR